MKGFVDASALVSIIAAKDDAEPLSSRLANYSDRYISAIAIWETVLALRRSRGPTSNDARDLVDRYLDAGDIETLAIDKSIAGFALDAQERFGKGRHPASLNMGDCLAYACAKSLGASLLYKGDDFAKTDLV